MSLPITFEAVNWNKIEDSLDKDVWDKLTANHWIDTKITLSGDIATWSLLNDHEKMATKKVLAGLTMLDTIQSEIGMNQLIPHAITKHEAANLGQIQHMEGIHAKSYSSIFSTLCSMDEISDIYDWARNNQQLQYKAKVIAEQYMSGDPIMIRAASVALESMLFYSGFYLPMYWLSRGRLENTADIIKLIISDESFGKNTELLTTDGWKNISEITLEDKVAQWHEDGTIDFANPTKVNKFNSKKTYEFRNPDNTVVQHVSENHRVTYYVGKELVTKPASEVELSGNEQFFGANGERYSGVVKTEKEGQVTYSVSVPSTFLLTRNEGSVTVTGNCIHGYYIGYKFQKVFEELSKKEKLEYFAKINGMFLDLYENEMKYIDEVFEHMPVISDVRKFVNYNYNKSMQNMGFEVKFSKADTEVSAGVMNALGKDTTHDFFSQSGNQYEVAVVEEMDFDDWGDMFGEDD